MHVLIDGLPLLGHASIGGYLRQLLLHLVAEDISHEYCLLFRGVQRESSRRLASLQKDSLLRSFPVRRLPIPDRLLELCWTHGSVHVPMTEALLGHPHLFLSTVHVTPVLQRTAIVSIAYDLIPMRFPQFYGQDQPLLAQRIRREIERADAIIAISDCTKRDYVELLKADPARIHVVYPGVNPCYAAQVDAAAQEGVATRYRLRRPYLLYVGVLAPHKNVQTLLRVFRRLKHANRTPHQLVVCGQSRWGGDIVDAARDLIAAGHCVMLDFIPDADLPSVYRGADAVALLSLYEGFGLPVVEAMACGVPVVASNAGALPEVVGDAALQVPPSDEEAIEDALQRVLTDASLREELRARGLRRAARFSWPEAARQTLKVFEAVAGTD